LALFSLLSSLNLVKNSSVSLDIFSSTIINNNYGYTYYQL
jgi:hypothetical protein